MTDADRDGVRCMVLRGGTSKGAFFLAGDVPSEPAERDDLMLRIMGSPDPAQIDGLGGAHPLTSKVAIVSRSDRADVDLDYLFLQVGIAEATVGTLQTCGNLLAAVGPFALERGLIEAGGEQTTARIRLLNTGDIADARFATPGGRVDYAGDAAIDGVPGTAAPIELEVRGEGGVLPTGRVAEELDGHRVTLIDNGMPVVLLDAAEFGVDGDESPEELEGRADLTASIERVRLAAAELMGVTDAATATVPKMLLLSPPRHGGAISTRAFIPSRVHTAIGVLMAASVAAGIRIPGAVGHDLADLPADEGAPLGIEHPSGAFPARVRVLRAADGLWTASSSSLRTARKIFDGTVYPRPAASAPAPTPSREDPR